MHKLLQLDNLKSWETYIVQYLKMGVIRHYQLSLSAECAVNKLIIIRISFN